MKIAICKERRPDEKRVAASPETVKKFVGLGAEVLVEAGAGAAASYLDAAYADAGASVVADPKELLAQADLVLKVQRPLLAGEGEVDELGAMKKGAHLAAMLNPLVRKEDGKAYAEAGVTAFAMEMIPRITRAQAMDVLSSQANLAGYRAVIEAANAYNRIFPMLMTAAGTVAPARTMVLGAGVAGLQAIATARRLGAVVSATDVRPAAKEQVESLGAEFVMVDSEETREAETAGGYAKEMSEDYKRRQAELVAETLKKQDIAITTALIPGRPAPRLITADMVKSMKPGSVIVDMAVEMGGNCELSKPNEVVTAHDVTIIGWNNLPSRVATHASQLYARNMLSFVSLLWDEEKKDLAINWDDDIVKGCALTRDGSVIHPALTGEGS